MDGWHGRDSQPAWEVVQFGDMSVSNAWGGL